MVDSVDELWCRYNELKGVYDVVEDRIFNYRAYVESCTGTPMSPQELHMRREELFGEMSMLWRKLPHEEKRGLDKWLK